MKPRIISVILGALIAITHKVNAEVTHLAIDTLQLIKPEHIRCLKSKKYYSVGVHIYHDGKGDKTALQNVRSLYSETLMELFVQPDPMRSAKDQVKDLVHFVGEKRWTIKRMNLVITDPVKWSNNTLENVDFIKEYVAAANAPKIIVDYFTNWYDYHRITGSSIDIPEGGLWYWNTYGIGPTAKSPRTISDFRPFGPFNETFAKLFSLNDEDCGLKGNKHIFMPEDSSSLNRRENSIEPLGGSL